MDALVGQKEHAKWINVQDVHAVMASAPSYEKILFSDGKTKLIDYLSALKNSKDLERFLHSIADVNVSLPSNSLLWPGSTPLHLAVMFSENMKDEGKAAHLVSQCLKQGALVQVQNQCGATPLHLAFRLGQQKIIALLMRILETQSGTVANLVDNDDLSYLHIACSVADDHRNSLARKLLSNKRRIKATIDLAYKGAELSNLKPGWKPLHVAVDQRQHLLVELLLQQGANVFCTDTRGSTVIHLLFGTTTGTKPLAELFFSSEHLKDCANVSGLTHLHVAVWFNDVKSVERLLDMGADIEATVSALSDKDLKKFEGCTPLRMAVIMDRIRCMETLIERGANILAQKFDDKTSPLSEILIGNKFKVKRAFFSIFWSDGNMQKFLEEKLGMTMLHMACCSDNVDRTIKTIDKGVNVNAKISDNSDFWRGYTPLHVLIGSCHTWSRTKLTQFEKLLQSGCDIDRQDSTGKTALHLAVMSKSYLSVQMVDALLSAGADINIVDYRGRSTISYAEKASCCNSVFENRNAARVATRLIVLVHKMKLIGLEVNEVNKADRTTVLEKLKLVNAVTCLCDESAFWDQVEVTKEIVVGQRGLTLRSFLFETGAISIYPSLTPADRSEVATFFQLFVDKYTDDWKFLCRLQCRKAVARLSLINPALDALKDFISPSFPDLCADIILKYLSNSELKLLIAASQTVD